MRLAGQNALITGGGSGIGLGIALALAREGCRVAVCGRGQKRLDEAVAEAAKSAPETPPLLARAADVGDPQSVRELFAWAAEKLGPIHILINSAGVNVVRRKLAELSLEDWDHMLRINASGAFYCMREVLPQMRQRGDGLIVNISSIAGKRASLLGGIGYTAAKFAMTGLGLTASIEEKNHGIRVTNVYPGEVETPILDQRPVPVTAEHRARILQPSDLGEAVLMIACLPPRAHIPELIIKPTSQEYT